MHNALLLKITARNQNGKKRSIMLHNLYVVWLFDFLYRQFIVFVTVKKQATKKVFLLLNVVPI